MAHHLLIAFWYHIDVLSKLQLNGRFSTILYQLPASRGNDR